MGRAYAGILGSLAFAVIVARNLVEGGNVESALSAAPLALSAFATIGYIIGRIAEGTIVEAVENKFHAQWQAEELARHGGRLGDHPVNSSDQPA